MMEFWYAAASAGPYTQTICTSIHTYNDTNTSSLHFYRSDALLTPHRQRQSKGCSLIKQVCNSASWIYVHSRFPQPVPKHSCPLENIWNGRGRQTGVTPALRWTGRANLSSIRSLVIGRPGRLYLALTKISATATRCVYSSSLDWLCRPTTAVFSATALKLQWSSSIHSVTVTSQSLRWRHNRHFVGITRYNALSSAAKIYRATQIKFNRLRYDTIRDAILTCARKST